MTPTELALRQQLEALAVDYWHEVDLQDGSGAPAYYTEDAVFGTSVREYRGRPAIEAFYRGRLGRSPRLSLHLMQNFRIQPETADRVHCQYLLTLYAGDGVPVLPSRPPVMISSVEETVLRQPDGRWLYQLRRVHPLFSDGSTTRG